MKQQESSDYVNIEQYEGNDENLDEIINVKEKVKEPKVGMLFNSTDEIYDFYTQYGKEIGFGTCRRTTRKDKNGEVKYVTITCGREGKSRCKSNNLIHPHPVMKMNCKARVCATVCPDGKWTITSTVLEHNHELSPSKGRFYRSNRVMLPHVKRRLEMNDRAGIRINKSFNSFVVEAGGHENLPFQEKDCRNYIDKVRRLRLGEGDATAIQNYFLKMQADNSDFFYMMDLDNKGRLRNVFWADARSRAAVKEFGDVITFDTTYLTNKYDMPFAPFVGVNHHGQSVLLGCGLISNEDVDTFEWLFRSWLTCMSGSHPSAIITDQDKAMKNAIEIVFPNTRHRWCLWHIMKKLPEKLRAHNHYETIKFHIQMAVYDSLASVEFEESWCRFIAKYNLEGNEWLHGLYEERHRWVPVFVKDISWAGMSTTQRSESMNAFFDGYVNSKTSLKQFVEQYENALRSKVEKENQEDFNSFNSWLPCITRYDMEKQFQTAYTTSKFKEFQQELLGKMYCELGVSSCMEGIGNVEYEVNEDVPFGESLRCATFKVCFNEDAEKVDCNCRLFQFRGILCRHAITVLIHKKMYKVPDKYILKRWDKTLKRCHTKVKISYSNWSAKPEARRFDKMCNAFYEVADLATNSEDRCEQVMVWVRHLKEDLMTDSYGSNQHVSKKTNDTPSCGDGTCPTKESKMIHTPLAVRSKGRPPFKRRQPNVEKVIKKNNSKKKKETPPTQECHFEKASNMHSTVLAPTVAIAPAFDFLATQESINLKNSELQQSHGVGGESHDHPAQPNTWGMSSFGQPRMLQEFGQPKILQGFHMLNEMQPSFYDMAAMYPASYNGLFGVNDKESKDTTLSKYGRS